MMQLLKKTLDGVSFCGDTLQRIQQVPQCWQSISQSESGRTGMPRELLRAHPDSMETC